MTKIKHYVEKIDEELCGAKDYAEKYIERKAVGDSHWASRFHEMAEDELKHAMYIHELATKDIEELNKVFTPTVEMTEKWDKQHKIYVEQTAFIKQMLNM